MTVNLPRRFLMILCSIALCAPVAHAHPQGATSNASDMFDGGSEGAAQLGAGNIDSQIAQLSQFVQQMTQGLSPLQQQCLMMLGKNHGIAINLIFLNPQEDPATFNEALNDLQLSKEEALATRQTIISTLEKESIPLEDAQLFYSILGRINELRTHQAMQKHGQSPQSPRSTSGFEADSSGMSEDEMMDKMEQESPEAKKAQALQVLIQLGELKNVLVLDPEKDATKIAEILARFITKTPQKLSMESLLQMRKQILEGLAQLDILPEEVPALIAESTTVFMKEQLSILAPFDADIVLHDPEQEPEYFSATAQKFAKESGQECSVEFITNRRTHVLTSLDSQGIGLEQFNDFAEAEKNTAWWAKAKQIRLAAAASTLFGASDLCTQIDKGIPQAANSFWNWAMGTVGFYPEHSKVWKWSRSGTTGRALWLAALYPTGKLWLDRTLAATVGENQSQLAMIKMQFDALKKQYPILEPVSSVAPYVIPAGLGQARETAEMTFQENFGRAGGSAAHAFFSKLLPLTGWAWWHRAKLDTLNKLVHMDQFNALNNTAFAFVPVAQEAARNFIDSQFKKITPKTGVFWKTFLENNWGTKLTGIIYGTIMRALLWQQYNNQKGSWLKVDRGSTDVRTKKVTTTRSSKFAEYSDDSDASALPTRRKTVTPHTTTQETQVIGRVLELGGTDISEGEAMLYVPNNHPENFLRPIQTAKVTRSEVNRDGSSTHIRDFSGFGREDQERVTTTKPDGSSKKTITYAYPIINPTDNSVERPLIEEREIKKNKDDTWVSIKRTYTPHADNPTRKWTEEKPQELTTGAQPQTKELAKETYTSKKVVVTDDYKKLKKEGLFTSKTDAIKPYLIGSIVQLLTQDLAVATATSGLMAANNKIVGAGKAVGRAVLTLLTKLGMKEETRKDLEEMFEGAQWMTKIGANLLVNAQSLKENPFGLVNNPAHAEKLIKELMESKEGKTRTTQLARQIVHRIFADKLYELLGKRAVHALGDCDGKQPFASLANDSRFNISLKSDRQPFNFDGVRKLPRIGKALAEFKPLGGSDYKLSGFTLRTSYLKRTNKEAPLSNKTTAAWLTAYTGAWMLATILLADTPEDTAQEENAGGAPQEEKVQTVEESIAAMDASLKQLVESANSSAAAA